MSCSVTERISSTQATVQNTSAKGGATITVLGTSASSAHQTRCRSQKNNSLSTFATSPSSRPPVEGADAPVGVDGSPQNGPASPQGSHFRSKPCGTMLFCCCCKCPWSETGNKIEENDRTKSRRKGLDSNVSSSKAMEEEIRVPADELRSWGKSFDKLMKSGAGRKVFRNFLKGEYSEENILFWLACEEFKKLTDKALTERRAKLIYMSYIHPDSPTEVSLDSQVRDIVKRQLQNPQPAMYDEAQLQIYTLMQRDSYPRFLNSSFFKGILQQADKRSIKEQISVFIPLQKTPSLNTIDLAPQAIAELSHATQTTPLLTAAQPAATLVSEFSDRDQDAS
ncbi:hypothetical protein ABEB36_011324 [Hypothenemus hampei]|uniref:RGS domain-containing protein n=1 Tax=Hypothenemus hampei TaxID=57062 RepID=A0ABD1EH28_HYPHA